MFVIQGEGFRDGGFAKIIVDGKTYTPEQIVQALGLKAEILSYLSGKVKFQTRLAEDAAPKSRTRMVARLRATVYSETLGAIRNGRLRIQC